MEAFVAWLADPQTKLQFTYAALAAPAGLWAVAIITTLVDRWHAATKPSGEDGRRS